MLLQPVKTGTLGYEAGTVGNAELLCQ